MRGVTQETHSQSDSGTSSLPATQMSVSIVCHSVSSEVMGVGINQACWEYCALRYCRNQILYIRMFSGFQSQRVHIHQQNTRHSLAEANAARD